MYVSICIDTICLGLLIQNKIIGVGDTTSEQFQNYHRKIIETDPKSMLLTQIYIAPSFVQALL